MYARLLHTAVTCPLLLLAGVAGPAFSQNIVGELATLNASDGTLQDLLGWSSDLHANTVILGAPGHPGPGPFGPTAFSGAAYVFTGTETVWIEQAKLLPSAPVIGGSFGVASAVYQDTAIVGAPGEGSNGQGAAYIFKRTGTSWAQEFRLTAFDASSGDGFGSSVTIDCNTILVGASADDDNGNSSGSVYVYSYDGTAWNFAQKLTASDGESQDAFGSSVGACSEWLAIGAPGDDDQANGAGAVYIFDKQMGSWTEGMKLVASDGQSADGFGHSLDSGCNTVVIGSFDDDAGPDSGAAYVFALTDTGWVQQQKLTASDATGRQLFGYSVAIDNDWVMVGAPAVVDSSSVAGTGSAYIFERSVANIWTELAKCVPLVEVANDALGWSVAIDRGFALAGAVRFANPPTGPGTGYIYEGSPGAFRSLCNGDGGDQMGCTNCPCGNNAPRCTIGGCLNSAGSSARLLASGFASVSLPPGATTDLRFGLSGAPPTAFCILNSGAAVAPSSAINPCFGLMSGAQAVQFDGLRCAIVNTRRHGGRSADATGNVGLAGNPWGGEGAPPAGLASAFTGFTAGETRFFQVINRDNVMLSCMRGLNTSQAVEVTFVP